MSRLQFLNVFLTERLTAVATEISAVLEQHLVEYQEEISRSNEENKRLQSLLDLVFSPEIKLHREDSQQLSLPVSEEEVPPEQQHCEQERSPSLGQEDLRTSQEEEQPQGLEPDTKDLLIPACVKSDYEQDPSLPPHLDQTLENRERDSQPTNTTEQIKTEPDGEDYRVSEPTRDSQLLSEAQVKNIEEHADGMERPIPPPFSPDSQQPSLPVSNEEVPPEQQERSPRLGLEDPEPTKQEELWTNQEEQQLESDSRVSEPTRDSQLISAVNPECSAAQSENRVCVDEAVEMLILLFFPPDSQQLSLPVSEEEVPPEQQHCEQESSPSLGQEDPEPTQIKEEQEDLRTSQEEEQPQGLESKIRVSEPTSLCRVSEPTSLCVVSEPTSLCRVSEPTSLCRVSEPTSLCRVSEPTSLCRVSEPTTLCRVSEPTSLCRVSEPTSLCRVSEPTSLCRVSEPTSLCRVSEPTSLCRVSEPTSLCRVLEPTSLCRVSEPTSVANPDCSAAQSEKTEDVDGMERPILPSYPPELPGSEEVPPEQQERSPSLQQEDPEPTKVKDKREEFRTRQEEEQLHIGLSESTSLCRVSEPTLSVANPDCSEAQVENIEEHVDGMERPIPPPFSPDSQQPSFSVSKEEVPPEQQERSPRLGLDDSEPTKQEELWMNQEEQQLESDSRVSEPTRDSQLISAVNPECSAAQSENGQVHQSPSTSSEQDSSNVESNKASHFSTWSDENISVTDSNSSDSSSCTKEDSEARKPAKRTYHSSGVLNEPSDLSNLCDENNPGTEISPSDGNKDMNIQTDSGAHNPAKRICQRVHSVAVARRGSGEMASCSRPKEPGSTPDYTHCLHCQGLYIQKSLWKHVRYCPLNPKAEEPKPGQKMRIQSAMAFKLCPQPDYVSTGLWKIVCGMNSGQVSFVVRNDKCILLMGEELYNKLQPDDRRNKYIQQRMREVARLLITARTCTPLMCFEDLVIPSNLPHVITAVRAVAGYNEENKTYDRPTLAVQMGYNLMNIGSAVESCALKSGRHKVAESAGKFKSFKWNEVLLVGALSTLGEPKNKCAQPTPVAQPTRRTRAQPTRRTRAQPTRLTRAQPTRLTGAQPTRLTGAQPTRRTGAQPTRRTGAQPTRRTGAQPTRRTGAQPTRLTGAQPTRRTGAQPTRRTGAQPTRRTGAQPTRRTGAQPTRRTGAQPTRLTGAQPTRLTGAQPTRLTGAQPTRRTGALPTRRTGAQPTRRTGAQPTRLTGTQPTRRTGTQPSRRNAVRLKWIIDEVAAVEKHMMPFLERVAEFLERGTASNASSQNLWRSNAETGQALDYVHNRIKGRQSTAGNSGGSSPDRDSNSGPETGNPTP
ncbi:uncharacterized protein LOC115152768 isoform X3 [Salmo trutta]|uniref:uncharacterized protein LOC115152768 isoform X3 n=1 Tax=Salmo trutta TaxID=8032 RepID=UPI0011314F10|nr:uncharacterized protein LOC115152768 isoform X3 [Salmo trutta]